MYQNSFNQQTYQVNVMLWMVGSKYTNMIEFVMCTPLRFTAFYS